MAENKQSVFTVERTTFQFKGRNCYSYFITGMLRGKPVKAEVEAQDIAGYEILDILFGDGGEAELHVTPFEFKDDSGAVIAGNRYSVASADENGEVVECPVRAKGPTDKMLLNYFASQMSERE